MKNMKIIKVENQKNDSFFEAECFLHIGEAEEDKNYVAFNLRREDDPLYSCSYYDFEKEIDEIKEKLENLKTLVENAEEWDKKIKDAAGEYILEDAQSWWEPSSDYEDEDMPGLIEDLAEIVGKEEAEKMVNDEKLSLEAFKKLIYVNSITLNEDGNFNVSLFDIDELIFSGHIMFVYGNINGEFSGGDFAG